MLLNGRRDGPSLLSVAQRGSKDPRIQKERVMNLFKSQKPYGRVVKLLKEMPWLWAVKPRWDIMSSVHVMVADDKDFLNWNVHFNPDELKSICYVHMVSDQGEQMIKVELEGSNRTWFDVMYDLYCREVYLGWVKHFVTVAGNDVRVDRAPKGYIFEDLFKSHPRYSGGHYRPA